MTTFRIIYVVSVLISITLVFASCYVSLYHGHELL